MRQNSFFKGIGRNIILLGLVSLLTDLSSQMVFPLVPLYLTSVLGASAAVVGLVEGAAETTASFLKVFSGYWSDKIKKRKPFVLIGYSLSAFSKPLFALATLWPVVLGVRVFERIGKGLRSAPRDAIVADSAEKEVWGKAYGFQRSMDGLGSILGAVMAFLLLPILGFTKIFWWAFIPGLFAIIAILFIKEKAQSEPKKSIEKSSAPRISLKLLSNNLRLFIVASGIFALGHFGYAFMLLKAKDIGLSNENAILMYVLFYGVYTLFTIPAGVLSDKIGRKYILILSHLFFVIISIGLIFAQSFAILILMFVLYGLFFGMIDGAQRAFVVDLCPKDMKATALGTFQTAIGLTALPGGFLMGLLWDKFGSGATFMYSAILGTLALIIILFVKKQKENPSAYHNEKERVSF